jgi:Domain of Unknown Function (DUF1206)
MVGMLSGMTSAPLRTRAQTNPARRRDVQGAAHAGGLVGLAARGVLYLALAFVSLELAFGHSNRGADTRGALHELSGSTVGAVLLALLALGFAAFAFWHLFVAWFGNAEPSRRLADGARAFVYGVLCAVAVSFLTTAERSGNSDRTDQTWTAKVLDWSIGPLLVGAVGLAIIGAGCYMIWRALRDGPQDEKAVLEAAPHETPTLHRLAAIGNIARGAVLTAIGVFLLVAAVQHDPGKTVGLDGTLKRLLDESFGGVLVVLVALGFAAFGVYSIARAWTNRQAAVV